MRIVSVHFAASGQQQVQDQHVPRPSSAGRLSTRNQLYLCTYAGRAGEVSEPAHTPIQIENNSDYPSLHLSLE